jgi:AraC-like DNA-binding protein
MWALILLISSRANKAKFVLGIFMLVVSVVFLTHVVYYHHYTKVYLYFDLLFIFGSLLVFPNYYWYVKILTFRSKIDLKDMRHVLPAFVMLAASAVIYILMSAEERNIYINDFLYGHENGLEATVLIKIQQLLCYLLQLLYFLQIVFSFLKIRVFVANYNQSIANFYSNLENKTMQWPKIILYSFVATSALTVVTNFLGRSFFYQYPILLFITGMGYAVFLFILGFLGYLQNHSIETFETDAIVLAEVEPQSVGTSKLNSDLAKLFEIEQQYKLPDLKITDIASRLNTNRTYISNFINTECGCSFSTYVNKYRVEEAKRLLSDKEYSGHTLEHISTLAGFGSLHSFIRVFKEIAGTTPGRFRK